MDHKELLNEWLFTSGEKEVNNFVLKLFDLLQESKRENQFLKDEVDYWRKNCGF